VAVTRPLAFRPRRRAGTPLLFEHREAHVRH